MADRYWVGDGGSWTNTSHWSTTSGGAGGASRPGSSDDVYFDENSFTLDSQTVTIVTSPTCACYNLYSENATHGPILYFWNTADSVPALFTYGSVDFTGFSSISSYYAGWSSLIYLYGTDNRTFKTGNHLIPAIFYFQQTGTVDIIGEFKLGGAYSNLFFRCYDGHVNFNNIVQTSSDSSKPSTISGGTINFTDSTITANMSLVGGTVNLLGDFNTFNSRTQSYSSGTITSSCATVNLNNNNYGWGGTLAIVNTVDSTISGSSITITTLNNNSIGTTTINATISNIETINHNSGTLNITGNLNCTWLNSLSTTTFSGSGKTYNITNFTLDAPMFNVRLRYASNYNFTNFYGSCLNLYGDNTRTINSDDFTVFNTRIGYIIATGDAAPFDASSNCISWGVNVNIWFGEQTFIF